MKLRNLHSLLAILLITAILISAVFLPGCRSSGLGAGTGTSADAPVSSSTDPQETSASPSETVPVPTQPVVEYITPTEYPEINTYGTLETPVLPIPAEDVSEEDWITFFYGLLSVYGSWYNMALTSFYEEPTGVNLYRLFYNGTRYDQPQWTEEEKAFTQSVGIDPNLEKARLPVSEMNTILGIYFGTAFSQYDTVPEDMYYLDKTDCYYKIASGAYCTEVLGIVGYRILENGDYAVRYVSDWAGFPYGQAEVVLRRTGDYFQIVANRLVGE